SKSRRAAGEQPCVPEDGPESRRRFTGSHFSRREPGTSLPRPVRERGLLMNLDDVKRRFVEEVKLRAFDDKYIDKNEEREILQIALQQGVGVDSARAALAQVCDANEYVLESRVMSELKDLLDTLAGNDGKVDEKEFNDAVAMCKKRTKGK